MNIEQAIKLLKQAELKQLALKTDETAIIGYINMGILELHKRFVLQQQSATVNIQTGVDTYRLDGTDSNVDMNLGAFEFMKVDEAVDEDGEDVSINNEKDTTGIITPTIDTIKLLPDCEATTLTVAYRVSPEFLKHHRSKLPIPPQMIEALFHYVGYRGHLSLSGEAQGENNTHYARFQASCKRIKAEGLYEQDSLECNKFENTVFALI